MNTAIIENLIEYYRKSKLDSEYPHVKKRFNSNLRRQKYLLIYPFTNDETKNVSLLLGFSNEAKTFKMDEESFEAFSHVEHNYEIIHTDKTELDFDETVIVETKNIEKLPIPEAKWEDFVNAPKIEEGNFSIIQDDFLEFFGLCENEHNFETGDSFNFNRFFTQKNIPKDLELRVVWKDVDSGEKYGNIITSLFWRGDFIGWVSTHGKWLSHHNAHTINIEKWTQFMEYLKELTGFNPKEYTKGVIICDMEKDFVEDCTYVHGFSLIDYDESEN